MRQINYSSHFNAARFLATGVRCKCKDDNDCFQTPELNFCGKCDLKTAECLVGTCGGDNADPFALNTDYIHEGTIKFDRSK